MLNRSETPHNHFLFLLEQLLYLKKWDPAIFMNRQCIHMILNSKTKQGVCQKTPPLSSLSACLTSSSQATISADFPCSPRRSLCTYMQFKDRLLLGLQQTGAHSALCLAPCFFTQLFILGKFPCEYTEASLTHFYGCRIFHHTLGTIICFAGALTASTISVINRTAPDSVRHGQ